MAEQRHREFSELSAKAEAYLEHPETYYADRKLLLRLWHYPSFDCHTSWLIYCPLPRRPDNIPLVREVVWDYPFDARRFGDPLDSIKHGLSPEPTFSSRQVEVVPGELELKLAGARKAAVPVFAADEAAGLDGERFGVETYGFMSAIRFAWWGEGREEWGQLIGWAEDMRVFLGACLTGRPLTPHAI